MYNIFFDIIIGFLNVFGTIYAVLSILRLTIKDLLNSNTWGALLDQGDSLLKQKNQARTGIVIIIISWIMQIVFSFVYISDTKSFVITLIIIILALSCVLFFTKCVNKNFEKKYFLEKEKKQEAKKEQASQG